MPSSINTFRIANDFESDFYQSQSNAFTNRKIVHLIGKIKRTINDNIAFNVYYGLRKDYQKNNTIKINVDEEGNFETFINLKDGDGVYYITANLLLDDNTYDQINTQIELSTTIPQIELFQIENYDFINTDQETEEKIYVFNKQSIDNLNVSFISYSDNFNQPRFYKIWLSSDEEPLSYLPLNKSKNFEMVNISNLSNGEYFIYLKIIDSFSNETFKRLKFNLNKKLPKLDLKYIKIVNDGYFINYEDIKNPVSLLVDIKSGLLIKSANYRVYKNDQILSPKSNDDFIKLNNQLTKKIQNSGIFYLDEFNLSQYFDLSAGNYNIEIFFTDQFDQEYVSNKIEFVSKQNKPNFYSNQLNINNPNSLILDYENTLEFIFEDLFFNLYNKQIKCYFENEKKELIQIDSFNQNWEPIGNNRYKTKISFSLNNNHQNFKNNVFNYNLFYFKMTNDYNEESVCIFPMVFKAKKNKIILHPKYVYPTENELNPNINYINSDHSSAEFLLNKESPNLNFQVSILNEVNFGQYSNYKTHNNELSCLINGEEKIIKFSNEENIYIDLEIPVKEHDDEESVMDEENYYFELFQTELKSNHSSRSNISQFYIKTFDADRFNIPLDTIYSYGLNDEQLIEIANNMEIEDNSFLSLKPFNNRFSFIEIKKTNDFLPTNYKELEEFPCKIVNINNKLKKLDFTFNIEFYKQINYYNDLDLGLIESFYYDLRLELPYEGLEKDLLFYFDLTNQFKSKSNFNKNSHEYEIIIEEGKRFIVFKNLQFNPNSIIGKNKVFYYLKYKNTEDIVRHSIQYEFVVNKKHIEIIPLSNVINNNKIQFEVKNHLNESIELKLNGINKEFEFNNNIITLHINNNEFYNKFKFKVIETNQISYDLPELILKQIKNKLNPIINLKNKFASVNDLNVSPIEFNNVLKDSNIKIESKIIGNIDSDNQIIQIENEYLLIDILNKNNNFIYYLQLTSEYQNKVIDFKFTINQLIIHKTVIINDNELIVNNLRFKYDTILQSDCKNRIDFDLNDNEYTEYKLLLNNKVIDNDFIVEPNLTNNFYLLDLNTNYKKLIATKKFEIINNFVFDNEIKIKRNTILNFISVLRDETIEDSSLLFKKINDKEFEYKIENTIYFLAHEKKCINIENNNHFGLEINGIVYKENKFEYDCSNKKELQINLINESGIVKHYKKIKIIILNKTKSFKFDFKLTNKSFFDLNKENFYQVETRLSVSKPLFYNEFTIKSHIDSYNSFSELAFFKNKNIKLNKFYYDLIITKYYLERTYTRLTKEKLQSLFLLLAYEYMNYYNGLVIPTNYNNQDLIKIALKININNNLILKLLNGADITNEINDL